MYRSQSFSQGTVISEQSRFPAVIKGVYIDTCLHLSSTSLLDKCACTVLRTVCFRYETGWSIQSCIYTRGLPTYRVFYWFSSLFAFLHVCDTKDFARVHILIAWLDHIPRNFKRFHSLISEKQRGNPVLAPFHRFR